MKICWDNLDDLIYDVNSGFWLKVFYYERKGRETLQKGTHKYKYIDKCKWCEDPFLSLVVNKGKFCCKSCGISHKQTGKPSGMSGKKHSMKARRKISKSNTGKIRTAEMRNRYSLSKKGKNNPWYGITGPAHYRYGKLWLKGSKSNKANLEAMWEGHRQKLRDDGLPYNVSGHPLKGIKRPDFSDKNNPNWLGGVTSKNESIRKSIEYKE